MPPRKRTASDDPSLPTRRQRGHTESAEDTLYLGALGPGNNMQGPLSRSWPFGETDFHQLQSSNSSTSASQRSIGRSQSEPGRSTPVFQELDNQPQSRVSLAQEDAMLRAAAANALMQLTATSSSIHGDLSSAGAPPQVPYPILPRISDLLLTATSSSIYGDRLSAGAPPQAWYPILPRISDLLLTATSSSIHGDRSSAGAPPQAPYPILPPISDLLSTLPPQTPPGATITPQLAALPVARPRIPQTMRLTTNEEISKALRAALAGIPPFIKRNTEVSVDYLLLTCFQDAWESQEIQKDKKFAPFIKDIISKPLTHDHFFSTVRKHFRDQLAPRYAEKRNLLERSLRPRTSSTTVVMPSLVVIAPDPTPVPAPNPAQLPASLPAKSLIQKGLDFFAGQLQSGNVRKGCHLYYNMQNFKQLYERDPNSAAMQQLEEALRTKPANFKSFQAEMYQCFGTILTEMCPYPDLQYLLEIMLEKYEELGLNKNRTIYIDLNNFYKRLIAQNLDKIKLQMVAQTLLVEYQRLGSRMAGITAFVIETIRTTFADVLHEERSIRRPFPHMIIRQIENALSFIPAHERNPQNSDYNLLSKIVKICKGLNPVQLDSFLQEYLDDPHLAQAISKDRFLTAFKKHVSDAEAEMETTPSDNLKQKFEMVEMVYEPREPATPGPTEPSILALRWQY